MAPVKSTIVTAILAFTTCAVSVDPRLDLHQATTTQGLDDAMGSHQHTVRGVSTVSPYPLWHTWSTTMKPTTLAHMPPRSLAEQSSGGLEKDLGDGAPMPLAGETAYCHTTASSPNITLADAAVAFFAALDKRACQNTPGKCLNMLGMPGDHNDIRVWTCGPAADSTECSNVAPILTSLISNCSKNFTEKGEVVTRVGGVAWLSPAKSAWVSLEGKNRD